MSMSVPGNSCRPTPCCAPTSNTGCTTTVVGTCVKYTGPGIPAFGINTGDTFNTVIQKITTFSNNCCGTKVIPYDSTAICSDAINVFIKLTGPDSEVHTFMIVSLTTGSIVIPKSWTGMFTPVLTGDSGECIVLTFFDSSNNALSAMTQAAVDEDATGPEFDITLLDHITFDCVVCER